MGTTYSQPVLPIEDTGGLVCMVLRSYDKFRVLHGSNEVVSTVKRIVGDLSCVDPNNVCPEERLGALQFRLPGSPFAPNAGRESATIGKIFAIRVFEEMTAMGYDLVVSSDLSRAFDQSTWFFRKVLSLSSLSTSSPAVPSRDRQPVLCVAPGSVDKLELLRCCDYVVKALRQVVDQVWTLGLQGERTVEVGSEKIHEFKLRGTPWSGNGREGEESALCRQLLLAIIGRLGSLHWRLLAATNLKGGADSLFFIYDESHTLDFLDLGALSLNRYDRLRLLAGLRNDDGVRTAVRATILRFHQTKEPEERDFYGAHEFKLRGYPFACGSGTEALATRQLLCRIMEELRDRGWDCMTAINVGRRTSDKSLLLFRSCESARHVKFACVALSDVDGLKLLNWPAPTGRRLRDVISRHYAPGVAEERVRDAGACLEVDLVGAPFSHESAYNLHARSMLTMLLREAGVCGWQIKVSADVSAKYVGSQEKGRPDYPVDVHSWFFCYQGVTPSWPKVKDDEIMQQQQQQMRQQLSYAELRVCDLEQDLSSSSPPTYEEVVRLTRSSTFPKFDGKENEGRNYVN